MRADKSQLVGEATFNDRTSSNVFPIKTGVAAMPVNCRFIKLLAMLQASR